MQPDQPGRAGSRSTASCCALRSATPRSGTTGDFIVTVVGGPNQRTDFHDDPCEEFFHQLRGDMVLRVWEDGGPRDIADPRGRGVPPPGPRPPLAPAARARLGRARHRAASARPAQVDGFEWYCPRCSSLVHRGEVQLVSLVDDLPQGVRRLLRRRGGPHLPGLRLGPPGPRGAARPAARRRGPAPPGPGVTVVDLHSHFFPETWPDLAERFGTPDWPWMRRDGPDRAMVMLGRSRVPARSRRPAGTPPCAWPTWTATASTCRSSRPRPVLFAYGRPGRARHGVRPDLQRRPARAVRARRRAARPDRPGAAAGHRPGLPGAGALPGGRHEGRADRQPRRRPRPRRRRPGRRSSPTARRSARRCSCTRGTCSAAAGWRTGCWRGRWPCRPRPSCRSTA